MKITIDDIKKWAKPHPNKMKEGKMTRLENDELIISIVGGDMGLYGDFVDSFELAIIDKKGGEFITKFFLPDLNDDVAAYLSSEEVEDVLNMFSKSDFQVS